MERFAVLFEGSGYIALEGARGGGYREVPTRPVARRRGRTGGR
jgi:hypothetical protein